MKYCTHCGNEVADEAVVCPKCGCMCGTLKEEESAKPVEDPNEKYTGYKVLSFFFPIVGLIFFLIEHDSRPRRAKACGKWALIGFIVGLVVTIIFWVLFFLFTFLLADNITSNPDNGQIYFNLIRMFF